MGELNRLVVLDYHDEDNGSDTSLYVGVRIDFGADGARRLTTPIQVARAAGYMHSLD